MWNSIILCYEIDGYSSLYRWIYEICFKQKNEDLLFHFQKNSRGNQMRSPSCPKIQIFDLEELRDVELKIIKQKLKKQSKSETSKSKIFPFDDSK